MSARRIYVDGKPDWEPAACPGAAAPIPGTDGVMTNLPGRCMGCGADVWYRGPRRTLYVWRNRDGKEHICPSDRSTCGAWMPQARERCVQRPSHRDCHRTAYAIANMRLARTGRAA